MNCKIHKNISECCRCNICEDYYCKQCYRKNKKLCHRCWMTLKNMYVGGNIMLCYYEKYEKYMNDFIHIEDKTRVNKLCKHLINSTKNKEPSQLNGEYIAKHRDHDMYKNLVIPTMGRKRRIHDKSTLRDFYNEMQRIIVLYECSNYGTDKINYRGQCLFSTMINAQTYYFYISLFFEDCLTCSFCHYCDNIKYSDDLRNLVSFCLTKEQQLSIISEMGIK